MRVGEGAREEEGWVAQHPDVRRGGVKVSSGHVAVDEPSRKVIHRAAILGTSGHGSVASSGDAKRYYIALRFGAKRGLQRCPVSGVRCSGVLARCARHASPFSREARSPTVLSPRPYAHDRSRNGSL